MVVVALTVGTLACGCGRRGFDPVTEVEVEAGPDGVLDGTEPTVWRATTPLPAPRNLSCAVTLEDRIYVIGGGSVIAQATNAFDDVLVADVQPDGSLGSWRTLTPLRSGVRWLGCGIDPVTRTIYAVGGDGGSVSLSDVARANVAADGSIGPWLVSPSLPEPRRGHSVVVESGVLYALGGEASDGFAVRSSVFAAPIAADGSLGAWTSVIQLPRADYEFGLATSNGRLYVTGGYTGNDVAMVAPAGQAFSATSPLPAPRERHVSVALDGFVYVIGGKTAFGGPDLPDGLRAPILTDGTLGTWNNIDPPLVASSYSSAVAVRGRIYVFGGTVSTELTAAVSVLEPPP